MLVGVPGEEEILMELIDARHITKVFTVGTDWLGRPKKVLAAVQDMSLVIHQGETVGLVGESGCGKSTFARTVLGLYGKTGGTVLYKGRDTRDRVAGELYRRQVQMIFQDPYSSLCRGTGTKKACRRAAESGRSSCGGGPALSP